ncbi:MAG: hypothetical protein KDA93_23550 [Planctomycetaceae bacterium]|nr:hypothetical protein [Planctomycetaceae bacterium]
MTAADELYLWGLIGLALSQPEPKSEFMATPYWILRQLGIIDTQKKGGFEFEQFRQGIRRLAGTRYENTAFYDPVRGEHRDVSFGFLNYSLPSEKASSRAWHFAWDAIFFDLCRANRGSMRFDMGTYRELSPAARRLYLLLKKIFWRNDHSPAMEIRHLGIDVLGFSPSLETKSIKRKLGRCVEELLDHQIVQMGLGQSRVQDCFAKRQKGLHMLQLYRGDGFDRQSVSRTSSVEDSPLYDPLVSIGFDKGTIARLLQKHPVKLIEQWADITLAAQERGLIQTSPPAYFQYYIQKAAKRETTPPDWWHDLQKQQRQAEWEQERAKQTIQTEDREQVEFDEYLKTEVKDAFERVMQKLSRELMEAGKDDREAREIAAYQTRLHFLNKYRRGRSSSENWSQSGDLLG